MQELIKKPVYAWVKKSKWTWYEAIKTPYDWLVSIETWNKANRWKIKIIEREDWEVQIVYKKKDKEDINPIIDKRKDYNSDYPYTKVLKCPICWWTLTWNRAKSRNWSYHFYYQCVWKKWVKHKTYSIKKAEVNEYIEKFFASINIEDSILGLFKEISKEVYNERKSEISGDKELYIEKIKWLKKLKEKIIDNIEKLIDFPILLKAKNEELENIEKEVKDLKSKCNNIKENINLKDFQKYSINVIKHLDKLVLQKEKPDIINLAFDTVFNTRIVFEKIESQTTYKEWLLALQSNKKNSSDDEFPSGSKWQSHKESNLERRIWSPELWPFNYGTKN